MFFMSIVMLAAGYASAGANICDDSQAKTFLNNPKNLRSLDELEILSTDAKLVLIGELHGGTPGVRAAILRALKSTEHNTCVFYELNRQQTIEQHLKKFSAPGYEESLREFSEIHATAAALGFKEFPVEGSYPIVYDGSDLNPRDQMMAQKILELFAQGSCERAVMLVGSDHMVQESSQRRPLSHLLATKMPIYRVRLQEATDSQWLELGSEYKSLMAWRGVCRSNGSKLPLPQKPSIFENRFLSEKLKLNPFADTSGFWREFDATILAK